MRRSLIITLTLLSLLAGLALRGLPQEGSGFTYQEPEITYGQHILFNSAMDPDIDLKSISLFLRPAGQETRLITVVPGEDGITRTVVDLTETLLRPFALVEYWYRLELDNGTIFTSPIDSFLYEDNRFTWQRLEESSTQVAWVNGDLSFGQDILNVTVDSQRAVRQILNQSIPPPLRIYVYPDPASLQSALQLTRMPWVAGHASPDIGVILLSIPPGPDQRAEMERQIPHELMHLFQYQAVGDAYTRLPVWLIEGMASIAERYPNPEYQRVLQRAIDEDGLLPLINLCSNFPSELSGAVLAYAQSASFVRYLYQTYGSSSLDALLSAYQDGLGCDEGVRKVYDLSLSQVEVRWQQQSLGRNLEQVAWENLRPYLLLSLALIIPVTITILPLRKRSLQRKS